MIKKICKKSRFRGHFGEQHGEREQAVLKSCRLAGKKLAGKKSLLLICKVLKLFVNALTARDKDSLCNRDNLTKPIQLKLSQKQETLWIFEIYIGF